MAESRRDAQLHGELRRLHYAQRDFASAEALLNLFEHTQGLGGTTVPFGSTAEGLWTGIAVSYMRPFTKGKRVAGKWERFADRPDLQRRHDRLCELRDKLFAHTDAGLREVLLLPFGGNVPADPPGFVTEQRGAFRVEAIEEVRELVQYQAARIGERVDELVRDLGARGVWRRGDL